MLIVVKKLEMTVGLRCTCRDGLIHLKSARKNWPLLEKCSLARSCKFYAAARMLGFSLKRAQNAVWDLIRVEEAQVA